MQKECCKSFGNHYSGGWFRWESSVPLKTGWGKVLWGVEYWCSLGVYPYKILIDYKRKNHDFTMENFSVYQSGWSRLTSQWWDGTTSSKDH